MAKQLDHGRSVTDSRLLSGGWSSQMRRLALDDGTALVQRSFVKPFFRHAGPGLLSREASVQTLLAGQEGIPAPEFVAAEATAEHCDHPTLLMSALPGRVRVDEDDLDRRLNLLAAQLVRIHGVVPDERPRPHQAWTSPERVRTPGGPLWERTVDVIRRDPPPHEGCFLHRDFHPGNVLFTGAGPELRISGVVDWVETFWGPADLDVAHCSTALALLHGPAYGLGFRERYEAHGGRDLADDPATGPDPGPATTGAEQPQCEDHDLQRGRPGTPRGWQSWLPILGSATMTVLITVWGASPGVGKSTLCDRLAQWLAATGLRVDHFREEEILTRPHFAAVAEEFKATGTVALKTLIAATTTFVDAVVASGDDVVIADALMPFVPTLLAMGHGEETIDAFMTDLTEALARVRPVMVFLDGNAESALSRAATREGEQWLDWYVGKLASYQVSPPVADAASAVKYLQRERAMTLGAVRRKDWGLVVIQRADELPPGEVLRVAQLGLRTWLGRTVTHG